MKACWREPVWIEFSYNYGKGHMKVNLNEFIDMKQLQKTKKLFNLIIHGSDPDLMDVVWKYIDEDYAGIPDQMKALANDHVNASEKVKKLEHQLKTVLYIKDQIKESKRKKDFNRNHVRPVRDLLKVAKQDAYWSKVVFNDCKKEHDFYEKLYIFYGKEDKIDDFLKNPTKEGAVNV
jgi:hypothetical protein